MAKNTLLLVIGFLTCTALQLTLAAALSTSSIPTTYRRQNFGKFVEAEPAPVKKSSFALAVEGFVNCQHCEQVDTASLLNSTRLAGAKVRLACRNLLYRTFVYETAYTNAHGYFRFHVTDYNFRLHKGVESCIVYLISSPIQACYKVTNINAGRIGASLTRQKVFPDRILYHVGPFAFAPPSCKPPSSFFRLRKSTYRFPLYR